MEALGTPLEFGAFPYGAPYPIQVQLMRAVYEAIETRKVAVLESPTGTVSITYPPSKKKTTLIRYISGQIAQRALQRPAMDRGQCGSKACECPHDGDDDHCCRCCR